MKTVTNITERWENGTPHHPRSKDLYTILEMADFAIGGDYLSLKSGGDGDNGEHLMYLLDIYFEAEESGESLELSKYLKNALAKRLRGETI